MNKKVFGYLFFGLACCFWIAPFLIGFIELSSAQKAIYLTTVVVLGEVFFVLSIFFLGKEFSSKILHYFKIRWRWLRRKL